MNTESPVDVGTHSTPDGRTVRASAQRESRRAHILSVALQVFAERGYHQTRVSDIIEAAGVARGTFYLYFESKNAIFVELLDNLLSHLRANVVGIDTDPSAPPMEEQLLETVVQIIETVQSNQRLATILVREAVGLDEEVDRKLHDFYASLHRYIVTSLKKGQTLGFVRSLDTAITASCILGSMKYVMEQLVMGTAPSSPVDVRQLSRGILDHQLRGLL